MTTTTIHVIDWQQEWDEAAGMWQQTSGHTRPVAHLDRVHSGPDAASRLLLAAQTGQLDQIDARRILQRLREMQVTDHGQQQGCLCWYQEEEHPVDTNASFFTGLSLIVLWQEYREQLSDDERTILADMLRGLYTWFKHAASEKSWFYPNKYLGDLTCVWLLCEITAGEAAELPEESTQLATLMLEAAAYWRSHGWGWGEHLSDGYSKVCLDELSLLLLSARRLPDAVRTAYKALFDNLLAIGDAFDGGPRVPALRSYAFLTTPSGSNYRETIHPLPREIDIREIRNCPRLGHTFHQLGWQQLAPPKTRPTTNVTVPCFGGANAQAHIEADIRLGSVSCFPLMPSIEHFTHGLAWQSMPVALSRPEKSWAFLQWEAAEGDRVRSHPAEDVKTTYLGNALTEAVHPPIVGRTWSLQRGNGLIALRIMPVLSMQWTHLADRLRIIGEAGECESHTEENWHQLVVRWGEREVSIHCLPLSIDAAPMLTTSAKATDWGLTYTQEQLRGKRLIATIWAISLAGRIDAPPKLQQLQADPAIPRSAEEQVHRLSWAWPDGDWDLTVDPLAPALGT